MADRPNPMHTGQGSTPIPDPTVLTQETVKNAIDALRGIVDAKIQSIHDIGILRHSALDETLRVRLTQSTERMEMIFRQAADLRDSDEKRVVEQHARIFETLRLHELRLNARPDEIDKTVNAMHNFIGESFRVQDEKFAGVEKQFIERDVRVATSRTADSAALSAALQAAKEAVGEGTKSFSLSIDKSEKATLEQINQQRLLLETTRKGLDDQIQDLKERMTRAEGDQRAAATALGTAVAEKGDRRQTNQWSAGLVVAIGLNAIGVIATLLYFLIGRH